MCGIAGILNYRNVGGVEDAEAVMRMTARMAPRGPDGESLWQSPDGRVVLGHRRLAIIDLSPAGAQPMADPETGNVIVFDGEIYNYRELRAELESAGSRFRYTDDGKTLRFASTVKALLAGGVDDAASAVSAVGAAAGHAAATGPRGARRARRRRHPAAPVAADRRAPRSAESAAAARGCRRARGRRGRCATKEWVFGGGGAVARRVTRSLAGRQGLAALGARSCQGASISEVLSDEEKTNLALSLWPTR